MIVVDSSSFITLSAAEPLYTISDEYDSHTTETVLQELEATAEDDDVHADAAQTVIDHLDQFTVHQVTEQGFHSSRVDKGKTAVEYVAENLTPTFSSRRPLGTTRTPDNHQRKSSDLTHPYGGARPTQRPRTS